MQSIDLHDYRVEIRHVRVDVCKISGIDRVDFGHKLRQAFGVLVELDQRPGNIQSNAVMST